MTLPVVLTAVTGYADQLCFGFLPELECFMAFPELPDLSGRRANWFYPAFCQTNWVDLLWCKWF